MAALSSLPPPRYRHSWRFARHVCVLSEKARHQLFEFTR